ncbi:hypothetical protein [Actinoplanes sp. NPDC049118]|uniref:hypothetical protein n=1 Tax=Actinoplanes sp. NPDC049118 TaxID=3155769 RepID=UPI0033F8A050
MREAAALAKKLWCTTLVAVVTLLSGCQSDDETAGNKELAEGESWAEQREIAKSILARYDENLSQSSQSPAPTDTKPSRAPSPTYPGKSIDSVVVDPGTTRMKVTFAGTSAPATAACGADYSAEAVESTKAVFIIILEQRNPYSGLCTLIGETRTATLNLARPLGDRAVLNIPKSRPSAVTTAPIAE